MGVSAAATFPEVPVDPKLAKRIRAAVQTLEDARRDRDRLIIEAAATFTLREVAEVAGMSHTAVLKIVRKAKPDE